jgi:hypothetical protein
MELLKLIASSGNEKVRGKGTFILKIGFCKLDGKPVRLYPL